VCGKQRTKCGPQAEVSGRERSQLPGGAGGWQLAAIAEGGFGFLERLVNNRAQHQFLIGWTQRVRTEMDAALGQLGEVGFVRAGGQKLVGILRRQPDRESPRPPLPGQLAAGCRGRERT
jgi:hypothetical protein